MLACFSVRSLADQLEGELRENRRATQPAESRSCSREMDKDDLDEALFNVPSAKSNTLETDRDEEVEVFLTELNSKSSLRGTDGDSDVEEILVIFPEPTGKDTVGKSTINECAAVAKANDARRAILAVQKPLTPSAKQSIETLDRTCKLEETDLLVNLKDSVFVPKYQILLPEEKKALIEKYKINSDGKQQLPLLRQTDPVARYLGLEKGQVVKINRSDVSGDLATQQAMYRIVT